MAATISATDVELQKPVNVMFVQTLLRNAQARCPYFLGTEPGDLSRNNGTATIKWRRIENVTPTTTALSELTGNASYMQGRDSTAASFTDVVATVAKYGQYFILNEEVDLFNFSGQTDKLVQVLGISAGRSMNQLQRNVVDDNATLVRPASAASDGVITSKITAATIYSVVNTLSRNSAMTFTPLSTGSTNIGTVPILPAFWGICHPDVAYDISKLDGFVSVEKYAGQVQTTMGEFGLYSSAGMSVRFVQTEDGTIDADAGGTKGSTGLRSTTGTDIDLYTTAIYGQDAMGSVGLGKRYTDGVYRAGDSLGPVEMIAKGLGSGGTSDPYNEIQTLAWKAWHAGKILNSAWVRAIRSGATAL